MTFLKQRKKKSNGLFFSLRGIPIGGFAAALFGMPDDSDTFEVTQTIYVQSEDSGSG